MISEEEVENLFKDLKYWREEAYALRREKRENEEKKEKASEIPPEISHHLRTGQFTIYYHNQGDCIIYLGHWSQNEIEDQEPDDKDSPLVVLAEMGSHNMEGYLPEIVKKLTNALGGRAHSV